MGIEMSGVAILNGRGIEKSSLRIWHLNKELQEVTVSYVSNCGKFKGRGKEQG
jgi:hypothetical protein